MTENTGYVVSAELHRKLVENERLQNEGLAQEVDHQAIPVELGPKFANVQSWFELAPRVPVDTEEQP